MIKFFRNIRLQLLTENKTGKYFKYALGEIILVVIGIMIALQFNNYNQTRISEKKATVYLTALSSEIRNNLERLDYAINSCEEDLEHTVWVMSELNTDSTDQLTDEYLYQLNIGPIFKTELERSVFDDMINTGVLENIYDQQLKQNIFKLAIRYEDYNKNYENAMAIWTDYILPYQQKHINVTGLWDSIATVKLPKLNFKNNLSAFVHNREFSNMLAARMRLIGNVYRVAKNGKTYSADLLKEIEKYQDNN